jgi:hypothetical protein
MGLIAMGKRNPLRIKVLSKAVEVHTMMVSSRVVMRLRGLGQQFENRLQLC